MNLLEDFLNLEVAFSHFCGSNNARKQPLRFTREALGQAKNHYITFFGFAQVKHKNIPKRPFQYNLSLKT